MTIDPYIYGRDARHTRATLVTMTTTAPPTKTTNAFYLQSALSFGVAFTAVAIAITFLPAEAWVKGFLAIGLLYLVTSSFTLAKTIRDRQEITTVVSRADQARLDKLLAEHNPYGVR